MYIDKWTEDGNEFSLVIDKEKEGTAYITEEDPVTGAYIVHEDYML